MKIRKANKMINEILKEDNIEIGIFISMLSYEYIRQSNITEKQFINSLKNSLEQLKKEEKCITE